MITETDLQEAITECEGQRNPNASTCIKLAAFYIIKNELFGNKRQQTPLKEDEIWQIQNMQSRDSGVSVIQYIGDSEFSDLVNGKDANTVMKIIDELMESVEIVIPRLYDATILKLKQI